MNLSVERIFNLADRFQVSVQATAIRCSERGGVSVFEIARGRFNWGHGAIRRPDDIIYRERLDRAVRRAMTESTGSIVVDEVIADHDGPLTLEWCRFAKGDRVLFLLHPALVANMSWGRGDRAKGEDGAS